MKIHSNLWLFSGVALLAIIPFWIVPSPKTEEEASRMFLGADGKAMDLVTEISPDYRPWFKPLLEPRSSEIASLLFSFQAALGAGVIGYYIGSARMREKIRRESEAIDRKAETGADGSPDAKSSVLPRPESNSVDFDDPRGAERAESGRAD
jgi:cobalt/nickel transport protein